MAVKHRCPYCRKVLREDRTCQNPQCVMYVPDPDEGNEKENDVAKSEEAEK